MSRCRRYFRHLRSNATLARRILNISLLFRLKLKTIAMRAWRLAFTKACEINGVCDAISSRNTVRRSYRTWWTNVRWSIHSRTSALMSRRGLRLQSTILKNWVSIFHYERRLRAFLLKQQQRRMVAHLHAWKDIVRVVRCLKPSRCILNQRWGVWKWKFRNRKLLRRVFSVGVVASSRRLERERLTEFQFVLMIFHGWNDYVSCKRRKRGCFILVERLRRLYLLTFLRHLRDTVFFLREREQIEEEKLMRLKQAYFLEWCVVVVKKKQKAVECLRRGRRIMLKYFFTKIQRFILSEKSLYCRHNRRFLMKSAFKALFSFYRFSIKFDTLQGIQKRGLKRKYISFWKRIAEVQLKFRVGFEIISRWWLRMKLRGTFFNWPGRLEFRKAEQMRISLSRGKRNICHLVDMVVPPLKPREVQSFIQPRRLNIVEKALEYGYLKDFLDRDGIIRLTQLLRAVFDGWRIVLNRVKELRRKARFVTIQHHRGVCRVALINWMYLTPRTSHRVLIWTLPRLPIKIPKDKRKDISSILEILSLSSALTKSMTASISLNEGSCTQEELIRC